MKAQYYFSLLLAAALGIALGAWLLNRPTNLKPSNQTTRAWTEAIPKVTKELSTRENREHTASIRNRPPNYSAEGYRELLLQRPKASSEARKPLHGTVPDSLMAILTPDVGTEFGKRIEAVYSLGHNLDSAVLDSLFEFLANPNLETGAEGRERFLRNEIMDKLVQQETVPDGLANLLLAIYENRQQDIVLRDYALQHMPVAYEKMTDEEKASLNEAMWQATAETDSSIAGTALLALLDVVGPTPPSGDVVGSLTASVASAAPVDDRTRLAQTALRLASDERCGELARITAVSVCGRLGIREALPAITQSAQSAPSIPLRIAAIAALGDMGDRQAEAFLRQVAQSSETRLSGAAEAALKRVQKRLGV